MRHLRLAVVVSSFVGGGAERVAIDLANHWSHQGRHVTLLCIDRAEVSRYPIEPQVQRRGLGLRHESRSVFGGLVNNWRRVRALRRELQRAEATAVVSFTDMANVVTLLASRGFSQHTVICERTDPRHHHLGRIWHFLRDRSYPLADALVVQTAGVAAWARERGWSREPLVIPNAAPARDDDSRPSRPLLDRHPPTILGLGRLSAEKGFDHLIRAFAAVAPEFPQWQLVLCGDGPDREALQRQAREAHVSTRVQFRGWVADTATTLNEAQLFVLPSQYEGFPNALLEAMAAGLACLAYDCPSGPSEIIRSEHDGLLVPPGDSATLAVQLRRLMGNAELRARLGTAALDVRRRFARSEFYRQWDAVLDCPAPGQASQSRTPT